MDCSFMATRRKPSGRAVWCNSVTNVLFPQGLNGGRYRRGFEVSQWTLGFVLRHDPQNGASTTPLCPLHWAPWVLSPRPADGSYVTCLQEVKLVWTEKNGLKLLTHLIPASFCPLPPLRNIQKKIKEGVILVCHTNRRQLAHVSHECFSANVGN